MNKVLKAACAVFVLTFMAANVFAIGEINFKAGGGLGPTSASDVGNTGISDSELASDFHIGAEFLYPLNDKRMKVGGGGLYISAKDNILPLLSGDVSWTYLPIYGTFQINPFSSALFFKANAGYVVAASVGIDDGDISVNKAAKGGLYLGLSVGFEYDTPWLWEISWSYLGSSVDAGGTDIAFVYNKVSFTVGYKFRLK